MEDRKQTAYGFSYCLFAYLYKKIDLEVQLPLSTDYTVPTTSLFSSEIGDCVLKIRSIFKPYLQYVISNDFPHICSEENLFDCTKWYRESLTSSESFTFLKLVILCSLLTELVAYYFQKKCFYFTSSAPTVLAEILLSSQVLVFYEPLSCLFQQLKEFCNEILQNTSMYSSELPSILSQEAKNLENNFMSLLSKNQVEKQRNNFEKFSESKKSEISSSKLEQLTKVSEFQIQDRENHKKARTLETSPESYDCKAIKRAKMTQQREDISCETTESISGFTSSYFQDNDLESIEQENEYDSVYFKPIKYDNVDEFHPSNTLESKLKGNIFNFSLYKSNRKLCQYCNYHCMDVLSDFIDDFKETNYEVD